MPRTQSDDVASPASLVRRAETRARSLVFLAPVDQVRAVPAHIPPHHLYRHLGIEPTTFVDQFCNLIRVAEEIAVAEQVELPAPGRATNGAPEDSGRRPREASDGEKRHHSHPDSREVEQEGNEEAQEKWSAQERTAAPEVRVMNAGQLSKAAPALSGAQVCEGAVGTHGPVVVDGGPEPASAVAHEHEVQGRIGEIVFRACRARRREEVAGVRASTRGEGREHQMPRHNGAQSGATPRLHDVGVLDDVFVQGAVPSADDHQRRAPADAPIGQVQPEPPVSHGRAVGRGARVTRDGIQCLSRAAARTREKCSHRALRAVSMPCHPARSVKTPFLDRWRRSVEGFGRI